MLVLEIKQYLIDKNGATLGELARHFNISVEHLNYIIEKWRKKGKINSKKAGCFSSACGCNTCVAVNFEIVSWNCTNSNSQ